MTFDIQRGFCSFCMPELQRKIREEVERENPMWFKGDHIKTECWDEYAAEVKRIREKYKRFCVTLPVENKDPIRICPHHLTEMTNQLAKMQEIHSTRVA